MKTLIKNIDAIYSPEEGAKEKQFLLIEEEKISRVDKMDNFDSELEVDEIIDAEGMVLLPGLINTHTHAAMTLMRGYADDMLLNNWLQEKIWPFESKMTSEDIYWGSSLAIIEMIKSGTTTFSDMYFAMDKVAEVVKKSGIRAVLAEGLIEANDGKKGLEAALEFAVDYNNTAEGRITTMLAPHAPYTCSKSYLEKIKKLAQTEEIPVHIHLSESREEVKNFEDEYNCSPVKFLAEINFFDNHVLAAHCVNLVDGDLEILRDKNVQISHNPMSNAKLANGIAPVYNYLKNNINVSLGTDGVSSNNSLDLFKDARMASYLQKIKSGDPRAINTQTLLKLLTINGVEALNLRKLGKIKKGYKADFILLNMKDNSFSYPHHNNLSNMFYAADSRIVDSVIINGKVIMKDREIKTLDQERIFFEAEKRAFKIADGLN